MANLSDILDYPLSNEDINALLEPDTNIITYPMLKNYSNIQDIFDSQGRFMLLYPTENERTGHWVCLIDHGNSIEFFDPYGEGVDDALQYSGGMNRRRQLETDRPLLSNLLKKSGKKVIYNKYPFQIENDDIATCGRHCVMRLLHKDKSLKEYANMIKKSGLLPDEYVSKITHKYLDR
jgi:hypothetical protein